MTDEHINGDVVVMKQLAEKKGKYPWMSSVVTTLISIAVAVGLTWYQINRAEQEEQKAEVERVKTVKATMVGIVEDHVINNQLIDIPRLSRLVDIKSRESNIQVAPRLLEIIQLAELNIINSGYLDFKTKDGYKKVFDAIYVNLGKEYNVDYSNSKNAVLIEQLISTIKLGNPEESITNLQLLLEAHSNDIKSLEAKTNRKDDLYRIFNIINEEPLMFIGFIFLYAFIFIIFFSRFRDTLINLLSSNKYINKRINKDAA